MKTVGDTKTMQTIRVQMLGSGLGSQTPLAKPLDDTFLDEIITSITQDELKLAKQRGYGAQVEARRAAVSAGK